MSLRHAGLVIIVNRHKDSSKCCGQVRRPKAWDVAKPKEVLREVPSLSAPIRAGTHLHVYIHIFMYAVPVNTYTYIYVYIYRHIHIHTYLVSCLYGPF